MSGPYLTISAVAKHFAKRYPGLDLPTWKVRRAVERGCIEEPPRIGVYRLFVVADLPRIEAGLRAAGYLPAEAEVEA
jgi:hypothetical protein